MWKTNIKLSRINERKTCMPASEINFNVILILSPILGL